MGNGRSTESFAIRGQGTSYTGSSAVVNYLAEVPRISLKVSGVQTYPGDFLDVRSLQVLRGPQGTLFGRNTTGGAILIEPAKPTEGLGGYAEMQVGNYSDRQLEGVVNLPLSDTLHLRFAGRFADRDGFTKDVSSNRDYDSRHYYTGRLGLLWKPAAGIENYLLVSGVKSRTNGSGFILNAVNAPLLDALFMAAGGCAGVGLGGGCSAVTAALEVQRSRGPRSTSPNGGVFARTSLSNWSVIDQLGVDLTDDLKLRNIVSYSEARATTPFDGDGTKFPLYQTSANLYPGRGDFVRQFTEEVQLQGQGFGDHLSYIVGVFYDRVRKPKGRPITNTVLFDQSGNDSSYGSSSYAAYGQATLDLDAFDDSLTGLKLTGGLRYTWDHSSGASRLFSVRPDGSRVCVNGNPVVGEDFSPCKLAGQLKTNAPTWTVGLDYQATRDLLFYGKVTRGYKTGGVNIAAVTTGNLTYRPEYVTTYEGGVKSSVAIGGSRLTANAAVFRTDYRNIQVATIDVAPNFAVGSAVVNGASARVSGVELDGTLRLGRLITLSANYSHLSGKYNKFVLNNPFGQVDCSGNLQVGRIDLSCIPLNLLARNQYSASASLTMPTSEQIGEVVANATWTYIGGQFFTGTNLPELDLGAVIRHYGLLNLSLNWNRVLSSNFDLSFFMSNAANKTYRINNSIVYPSLGLASSLYGEPRFYGVRARYSF